jgi:hypothetical protein
VRAEKERKAEETWRIVDALHPEPTEPNLAEPKEPKPTPTEAVEPALTRHVKANHAKLIERLHGEPRSDKGFGRTNPRDERPPGWELRHYEPGNEPFPNS